MDITEKILKLVALGWDGKEPELDFFQRVYGIKVEIIPDGDTTEVIISFGVPGRSCRHCIRVKKKKVDPVRYCLRLFRTRDGEVEGPKSKLFVGEDQEWS